MNIKYIVTVSYFLGYVGSVLTSCSMLICFVKITSSETTERSQSSKFIVKIRDQVYLFGIELDLFSLCDVVIVMFDKWIN